MPNLFGHAYSYIQKSSSVLWMNDGNLTMDNLYFITAHISTFVY